MSKNARIALWTLWLALAWTLSAGPPSIAALVENTILRAAMLGMPVALWCARDALRPLLEASRLQALGLAVALIAAAAVRWLAEPLPWHGHDWLEILAPRVVREPEVDWYSNGFGVWMRTFHALRPDLDWAIFTGNRVAGTLVVAATWLVARLVWAEAGAALAAAWIVALVPLGVRLDASESMQPVASLFSMLAIAGVLGHARTGRRALIVMACGAYVFAALTRPEAMVVAAALPLAYLAHRSHAREGLSFGALTLAGVVPASVQGALWMSGRMGGAGAFVATPFAMLETWVASLSTAGFPHGLLAALGMLGLLWTLRQGRAGAWIVLVALLGRIAVAGFDRSFSNRWQLLVPEWPLLAIGGGVAVAALISRVPVRARLAVASAMGLVLAGLVARAPVWRADYDQQQEYRFLRDSVVMTQLGPRFGIARASKDAGEGLGAWFPSYRLPAGTPHWTLHELMDGASELPVAYYRGLWCWTPEGPAEACRKVEEAFVLEPMETVALTTPTYMGPGFPAGATIGFFRVTGRR